MFAKPEAGVTGQAHFLSSGGGQLHPADDSRSGLAMEMHQVRQQAQYCGTERAAAARAARLARRLRRVPNGNDCGNGVCEAGEKCTICPRTANLPASTRWTTAVKENIVSGGKKFTVGLVPYASMAATMTTSSCSRTAGKTQTCHFLAARRATAPRRSSRKNGVPEREAMMLSAVREEHTPGSCPRARLFACGDPGHAVSWIRRCPTQPCALDGPLAEAQPPTAFKVRCAVLSSQHAKVQSCETSLCA